MLLEHVQIMPIWWSIFSCTRSEDAGSNHLRNSFWAGKPCGDDVSRTSGFRNEPAVITSQSALVGTTLDPSLLSFPTAPSPPTIFRFQPLRNRSKMSFGITRRHDPTVVTLFPNRSHLIPSAFNASCRSDSTRPAKPSWLCSSAPNATGDGDSSNEDRNTTCHHPCGAKTSNMATPNRLFVFETRDESHIPSSVLALFVYLARQGVHVNDLFRRPGNISQMKQILECFTAGHSIDWDSYNVYTVANVAKKLLLSIPGGLFGPYGEEQLLATADSSCSSELDDIKTILSHHSPVARPLPTSLDVFRTAPFTSPEHKTDSDSVKHPSQSRDSAHQLRLFEVAQKRISVFLRVLSTLPPSHQELAVLMFGILHQLVFHSASNGAKSTLSSMLDQNHPTDLSEIHESQPSESRNDSNPNIPLMTLAEGVVKSVAGTLFHTCSSSVKKVEQTAQVLRSLVLHFPSMGESVLRFYIDAVSNRLKTPAHPDSVEAYNGSTPYPGCILCPATDHSNYFDESSPVGYERRPCPINLFHAASRLFCLNGSSSTPICRKAWSLKHQTHTDTLTKPQSASIKPSRFMCPPFSCKIHASPTTTVTENLSLMKSHDAVAQSPILMAHYPKSVHTPMQQGDVTHGCVPGVASPKPQTPSEDTGKMDEFSVMLEHNPTRGTLRRNHSRYKSLRRRQMENLSRRAEWFLGPTTLPIVKLTPSVAFPSADTHPRLIDGEYARKIDLVVTSTVSLLDLDDSVELGMRGSNQLGLSRLSAVPPPRLLFTASTGELGEPEFDISSKCPTTTHGCSEPVRQRYSSVGSYLDPTHADSYISLHSAPSCGLNRFEDKDMVPLLYPLRCYPHELKSVTSHQPLQNTSTVNLNAQKYSPQPPASSNMTTDCPGSSELRRIPSVHDETALRCPISFSGPFSNSVCTSQNASCSLLYRPYEDCQRPPPLPFIISEIRGPDGRPRRNSALPALQTPTRPIEREVIANQLSHEIL